MHCSSLFLPFSNTHVTTCITECLVDISAWSTVHHRKLILSKTELLLILGKDCPHMDLSVSAKDITVSPSLMTECPSPWTLLQWPNPADLQSTTSQQDPVFPRKGHNTTPGPSAGHLPPGLMQLTLGWTPNLHDWTVATYPECCSVLCFQSTQILPHEPSSSVTSTGFLLQPMSDSRWWCWHSRLSMELHPSISKHCSDHMPQHEHLALLHQLALWYCHQRKERSLSKVRIFCVLDQWWNELTTNVRTAESLAIFCKRLKTHLFRLHLNPA